jgi:tRNA 2-thiouridine synthesizing protein A
MAERLVDTRGLSCPLPVLKARKALAGMAPGERLRLLASDPKAVQDIDLLCDSDGHRLIERDTHGTELRFVIERSG